MAKGDKKRDSLKDAPQRVGHPVSTEAVDNYLKAIFQLSGRAEVEVSSTEIAVHLGITPASVTNMLQKLAGTDPPLVAYRKHHGVTLAKAGRRRALEIIRHHRLLETFLHEVLDYPWDEVHGEAERLEHFISERFEERIAARLGHPDFDPHGHAIPALDGTMPAAALPGSAGGSVAGGAIMQREPTPLAMLRPGHSARVSSVSDSDPAMLRYLAAEGIRPGVRVTLTEQMPFGGAFHVRLKKSARAILLSEPLANAILVHER